MPILPSGQEIRIDSTPLTNLLTGCGMVRGKKRERQISAIRSVANLLSRLPLTRIHTNLRDAPVDLVPARKTVHPDDLPEGRVAEPLGCTLANWRSTVDWSEKDKRAFAAYLDRTNQQEFIERLFESVRESQQEMNEKQVPEKKAPSTTRHKPREKSSYAHSPEEAERLKRLQRVHDAEEAELVKFRAIAPFDYETLPFDDYGPAFINPAPRQSLQIGGIKAHIVNLYQYAVYAGVLCGMPFRPERDIHAAIRQVQKLHPGHPDSPLIVPPRLRRGHPNDVPWAMVPPVCTIAMIADGDRIAVLVWFQDRFGLPTSDAVLQAIAKMEWNPGTDRD